MCLYRRKGNLENMKDTRSTKELLSETTSMVLWIGCDCCHIFLEITYVSISALFTGYNPMAA